MIEAQIEIAAPPSRVREIFLDFPNYPKWHETLLKDIQVIDPSKPISKGEKITFVADGRRFVVTITEESDCVLQWRGSPFWGIFGLHSFYIEPTNDDGSSTMFRQKEEFSGPLKLLMRPSLMGKGILDHFKQFNDDLKAYVEASFD